MQMNTQRVADGMVVSIAYTLMVDGQEFESATREDPLVYLHGAENIIPGLENALTGRAVGEVLSVTVEPAEGYGDYDAEDIETMSVNDFPEPETLEIGTMVEVEDEAGDYYVGFVREINGEEIILDFNPPLAGKTLTYNLEVIDIRPATEEELAHGHVHGDEFYMDEEEWDDDELEDDDFEDEDLDEDDDTTRNKR
jgi:FKBP-type peptidyl-prolyl cis-trans isomerase SlyD